MKTFQSYSLTNDLKYLNVVQSDKTLLFLGLIMFSGFPTILGTSTFTNLPLAIIIAIVRLHEVQSPLVKDNSLLIFVRIEFFPTFQTILSHQYVR